MSESYDLLPSPLGTLVLVGGPAGLGAVSFPRSSGEPAIPTEAVRDPAALAPARSQLAAYLAGELRRFTLVCDPAGTPFQQAVWTALTTIPYGTTVAYRDVAAHIGRPRAVRAVAQAIGRNPLPIVVPCHRVIGADGSLTGFSAGLDRKRWLLALEGVDPDGQAAPDAGASGAFNGPV